jgi:hypothetical protein
MGMFLLFGLKTTVLQLLAGAAYALYVFHPCVYSASEPISNPIHIDTCTGVHINTWSNCTMCLSNTLAPLHNNRIRKCDVSEQYARTFTRSSHHDCEVSEQVFATMIDCDVFAGQVYKLMILCVCVCVCRYVCS